MIETDDTEPKLNPRSYRYAESLAPDEVKALAADLSKLRSREGLSIISFELLQAARLVSGRFERPECYHRDRRNGT